MTKFTIAVGLLLALSLGACKEEVQLTIPEEELVSILADLHIAEAAAQDITNPQKKDSVLHVFYQQVFDMHQADTSLFYANMEVLKLDPLISRDIYVKVLDKLNAVSVK